MTIPTFVIPFYGEEIGGGAETLCRRLAENCALRGVPAEVLTTTIRQPGDSWNASYHEYGVYDYSGVTVRRFPTSLHGPGSVFGHYRQAFPKR